MYTYQLEKCGNKEFLFEFFFGGDKIELVECQSIGGSYVNYRLLRKDKTKEDKIFGWKGCLRTDQSEPFELYFPDKINIKGEMKLFNRNGQSYIWINVYYGRDLELHFQGNILEIPCNLKPEPIPD